MPLPDLAALSTLSVTAAFALAAAFVWLAGTQLAYHGDEIAERYGLGKEFIGLIFLATVTELPEVVTTLTASTAGNADLVLGNMFGGISMQTAILAVADIFVVRHALTSWPRKPNHALLAVLLIILLGTLLAVTLSGDFDTGLGFGVGAFFLSAGFPLVIVLQRNFDRKGSWAPVDLPDEKERASTIRTELRKSAEHSTRALLLRSVFFSIVILLAGVTLVVSAEELGQRTMLGSSFIGITALAAATSLPELSTTLAAARIGVYTMAISNIIGSNLIMLALILPADMAYRGGLILNEAGVGAQMSVATGIIVTAIYAAGILIRRTPSLLGAGLDSWLVLSVYLGSLNVLYYLR